MVRLLTLLASWIVVADTATGHEMRSPDNPLLWTNVVIVGDGSAGVTNTETGWKVWERPLRFDSPRALVIGMLLAALACGVWLISGTASRREVAGAGRQAAMNSRLAYRIVAATIAVVVAYASLVPFRFRDIGFTTAQEEFGKALHDPQIDFSWADFAANLILFVPLGFALMGATSWPRQRRSTTGVRVLATLLAGGTVSLIIEFGQTWIHQRIPSRYDMTAQLIGTMFGVTAWIMVGSKVTSWLAGLRHFGSDRNPLRRALLLFVLVLTIFSILPLDMTIRPNELHKKYQAGRIVLVPFADPVPITKLTTKLALTVLLFIPVGLLITWTTFDDWYWSVGVRACLGIGLVVALELAQLLVYSRSASSTDVIAGSVGILLGAWVAGRLGHPTGTG